MGWKQKHWAVNRRQRLVDELGGVCQKCGTTGTLKNPLQIDHINGRNWTVREIGSDQRVCRYLKEAKDHKLQVLCKSCNCKKGSP